MTWLYDVVFTSGTSITQGVITVSTTFTVMGDADFTSALSCKVTDSTFQILDNTTPTKILQFQCSGITAATTRTLTVPDANDTIVCLATTDTLTNKTLTSPKINEAVALTTTATKLNFLTSAAGTTGTASTNVVFSTSPTLVTPVLGVATGTSLSAAGLIQSTSATAGVGYGTGAGNLVSQGTSQSTAVTLNAVCGQITMFSAALVKFDPTTGAGKVKFTVNNNTVSTNDNIVVHHISGGTDGAYLVYASGISNGVSFSITVVNMSGGTLTEAPVLQFSIIKSVAA